MPAVRNLVSALNKLAQAAHHAPPHVGGPPGSEPVAGRARRAVPPMPVRVGSAGAGLPGPSAGPVAAEGPYARGGTEPPLDEVLRDPIVRALMRRDGLGPEEVRRAGRPPLDRR